MAVFRVALTLFLLAHATSPLGAAEISLFCTDALSATGNSDLHRLHRGHSGRQRATGSYRRVVALPGFGVFEGHAAIERHRS